MLRIPTSWLGRVSLLALAAAMLAGTVGVSADLDPKAITVQLPKEIKWTKGNGSESAILVGDPSKPGLYVVLQKWLPHNNSRPHSHPATFAKVVERFRAVRRPSSMAFHARSDYSRSLRLRPWPVRSYRRT